MNSDVGLPFRVEPHGVQLAVRLTPRAKRNEIAGVTAGADGRPALAVRLAAPPVEGAANKALVAFLAERLGLPRSSVSIRSGATARLKILFLSGDGTRIIERLAEWD